MCSLSPLALVIDIVVVIVGLGQTLAILDNAVLDVLHLLAVRVVRTLTGNLQGSRIWNKVTKRAIKFHLV